MKLSKFKFNSNYGTVTIDGNEIDFVRGIKINRNGEEDYTTVTLIFDAEVEVEGDAILLPSICRRNQTIKRMVAKYKREMSNFESILKELE